MPAKLVNVFLLVDSKGVWALKQDHKSPAYTTEWDEVAAAKC